MQAIGTWNNLVGPSHLVRVGAMGQVGLFGSSDAVCYPRGSRVVLRTPRGLEVGQVLSAPGPIHESRPADGSILRGMTSQDELLEERLLRHRDEAYLACQRKLLDLGLNVSLMDVEHLFDGQTLVFYFLGADDPRLEAITTELADAYETKVQFRSFAQALTEGCGPGCGTEAAAGGACDSCGAGCAIAGACSPRSQPKKEG